ncbi:syndecan isoform X1 [Bradysia coprophila]|uniref:syndecan isoform X1 n=1 Tax=Bradysia coprophila TaxID=38358 RepID=UPI00187DD7F6|nr:syndecan isoform X1 [Bradysia coprophila]
MRIHISLVIILILGTIVTGENNNNSESKTSSILQSSSVAPVSTSHSTPRDEIYIDDEGLEGSGGRGEIHDDLEKEPEYSGSGFGPDDEDSSSSHHTPHHNTNTNNRKDQTDLELGSGDNGDDEDDFTTDVKHTDIDPTTTDDEDVDIGEPNIGTERKTNTGLSPSRDENEIDLDPDHTRHGQPTEKVSGTGQDNQEVLIMNTKSEDRTASFFAQPGILAAVIGGAVVGLLCAILVVMFIVYRMRKKDEGSYALDEPKRSPAVNSYAKNANNREFYA